MTARLHLSLRVSDLERSVAFYSAMFGEAPDKRREGYARFMPADTPVLLSLLPGQGEASAGRVDHMGVRLPDGDALAAAHARLADTGLIERIQENTSCCYAVQDKLWLQDPDGHSWEIYVVTDEDGQTMNDTQSACCPTPEPQEEPAPKAVSCCG